MTKKIQKVPTQERIARNLRRIRKERGLSQTVLADQAQLTQAFISLVERTGREISIPTLDVICGILKVDIAEMFKVPEETAKSNNRTND